jgi:hypothetical protein
MKATIYKYTMDSFKPHTKIFEIQGLRDIYSVTVQNDVPVVYAGINLKYPEIYKIEVSLEWTGEVFDGEERKFLGTVTIQGLVCHLFWKYLGRIGR